MMITYFERAETRDPHRLVQTAESQERAFSHLLIGRFNRCRFYVNLLKEMYILIASTSPDNAKKSLICGQLYGVATLNYTINIEFGLYWNFGWYGR